MNDSPRDTVASRKLPSPVGMNAERGRFAPLLRLNDRNETKVCAYVKGSWKVTLTAHRPVEFPLAALLYLNTGEWRDWRYFFRYISTVLSAISLTRWILNDLLVRTKNNTIVRRLTARDLSHCLR